MFSAPAYSCLSTTIGDDRLNFRVRDGIGCTPVSRGTENIILDLYKIFTFYIFVKHKLLF